MYSILVKDKAIIMILNLAQIATQCYKTKVQTDFGRIRVRTEIEQQYYYQSTTGKGHMTWKSCEMMSQAQSDLEEFTRLEEPRQ